MNSCTTLEPEIQTYLVFFFPKRALVFHTLVSVKVQKWSIKMKHLYKDDHIKDGQSTCRGSCNTRMECWWPSTSSTSGSLWYSTPLSALCTQWGERPVVLSSLSVMLGSSGPDRHGPKTKKSRPSNGFTAASCLEPGASRHDRDPSIPPCVLLTTLCRPLFCVGAFYSALPLFESTVAPGCSLGIGTRERFRVFKVTSHTHTVVCDGWHSEDCGVCGCKCVWEGKFPSWQCKLPPSPNT